MRVEKEEKKIIIKEDKIKNKEKREKMNKIMFEKFKKKEM